MRRRISHAKKPGTVSGETTFGQESVAVAFRMPSVLRDMAVECAKTHGYHSLSDFMREAVRVHVIGWAIYKKEKKKRVTRRLGKLSQEKINAIRWRREQGQSYSEIAESEGVSKSTAHFYGREIKN